MSNFAFRADVTGANCSTLARLAHFKPNQVEKAVKGRLAASSVPKSGGVSVSHVKHFPSRNGSLAFLKGIFSHKSAKTRAEGVLMSRQDIRRTITEAEVEELTVPGRPYKGRPVLQIGKIEAATYSDYPITTNPATNPSDVAHRIGYPDKPDQRSIKTMGVLIFGLPVRIELDEPSASLASQGGLSMLSLNLDNHRRIQTLYANDPRFRKFYLQRTLIRKNAKKPPARIPQKNGHLHYHLVRRIRWENPKDAEDKLGGLFHKVEFDGNEISIDRNGYTDQIRFAEVLRNDKAMRLVMFHATVAYSDNTVRKIKRFAGSRSKDFYVGDVSGVNPGHNGKEL